MATRRSLLPFLLVGAALLANAGPALASTRATAGRAQYTRLVWSDEFTGSAGTAPNVRKWVHDVGTFGWTDNELQTYTASPANASLDGRGDLATVVRRQTATGPDGLTRNYTSAKLETQGLFSARYGTFVAGMQLPAVSGLWPAFWMVGDDFATVAWPASGEIDAMEAVGQNPFAVSGTVHGPSLSSSTAYALGHTFTSTTPLTGGFHVYGITWSPTSISWTVDGRVYGTTTTASLQAGWGVAVHPAVPSDPQPRPGRDLDRSPELGHAVPVQSARRLGARVSVGRRTWCAWFPLRNALAQADYMGK